MSDSASARRTGWMSQGACLHADPDLFFPASAGTSAAGKAKRAKAVCGRCPVRAACLAYALATHQLYGIWGGATEKERRLMARSVYHGASSHARGTEFPASLPPASLPPQGGYGVSRGI